MGCATVVPSIYIYIILLDNTRYLDVISRDVISVEGYALFSQLKCRVNGKRLVGLTPTLWQQVGFSAWCTRAWTL